MDKVQKMKTKETKVIYSIIYSLEKGYKKCRCEITKSRIHKEIKDCRYWLKGERSYDDLWNLIEIYNLNGTRKFRISTLPLIEKHNTYKVV